MTSEKRLRTAQSLWKYGINHPSYAIWYKSAVENFNFFSGIGDNQWSESDLAVIRGRGQIPLTFNLLPSFVNALSGVEIQSRYRIGCRIDLADRPQDQEETQVVSYSQLSKAITHFLLSWQRLEKVPEQGTWKFQDAMICGMAWSSIFKEGNVLRYKYSSPLEVIPDFDDMSPQFENMKYVLKEWYIPRDEILNKWKKAKSEIDFNDPTNFDQYSKSRALDKQGVPSSYESDASSVNPLVCEVQYKEACKAYSGLTKDGRYFETFNFEKAEELADSKGNIDEFASEQIIRTRFIGDCLLESTPLDPSFPGQRDFSFIPFVWAKNKINNVPYGFIEPLQAIQRDLNKRVTNSIYYMQSSQYIIEGGNPMKGVDLAKAKRELNNRNSIIQIPVGSKITVNSSIPLGEEQIKIVREYLELFKRISGIQDEMLGIQTNATSGIAQKIRQVNSVRTNVFSFDNLSYMKEREAKIAVLLFQNSFYNNYYVAMLDGEEVTEMYLNLMVEDLSGNKRIENDISFLPVTLYFEEMHNVVSSLEDIREGAIMISQNPNLLQFPSLLKDMGLRHADKYVEDFQKAQQQQMQQQQLLEQNKAMAGQQGQQQQSPVTQQQQLGDENV